MRLYSVYYISVGSSTCFRCRHPSSGARITVITAYMQSCLQKYNKLNTVASCWTIIQFNQIFYQTSLLRCSSYLNATTISKNNIDLQFHITSNNSWNDYPQRKKSHDDKSGDLGGHGTSPKREMRRPGNTFRRMFIGACAVWHWGYLKGRVYTHKPRNLNELKDAIRQEVLTIDQQLLARAMDDFKRRIENCIQEDGRHLNDIIFHT